MTYTNARSARIGFATLVATILTAGLSGDAVAKAHKGHLHAPSPISESRAERVWQQPAGFGPMRGPKSPMWREVR